MVISQTTFNGTQVKTWDASDLKVGDLVLGFKPTGLEPEIFKGRFRKHVLKGAYRYFVPRSLGYLLTATTEEFKDIKPTEVVTLFSDGKEVDVKYSCVPNYGWSARLSTGFEYVENTVIYTSNPSMGLSNEDSMYTPWVVTEDGFEVYLTPSLTWTPSLTRVRVSSACRQVLRTAYISAEAIVRSISLVPFFVYKWLRLSWFTFLPTMWFAIGYWWSFGLPTSLSSFQENLGLDYQYMGASALLFAVVGLALTLFKKDLWVSVGNLFKPQVLPSEIMYEYGQCSSVGGFGSSSFSGGFGGSVESPLSISRNKAYVNPTGSVNLSTDERSRLGIVPFLPLYSVVYVATERKYILENLDKPTLSLRAFDDGYAYCLDFEESKVQSQLEDLLVHRASSSSNLRSLKEIVKIAFSDYEMRGDSTKLDTTIGIFAEYTGFDEGYIRERLSKLYHGGGE